MPNTDASTNLQKQRHERHAIATVPAAAQPRSCYILIRGQVIQPLAANQANVLPDVPYLFPFRDIAHCLQQRSYAIQPLQSGYIPLLC